MDSEDEIKNLLLKQFKNVYCDTCNGNLNVDECDECHRKNMNWELSENTAKAITKEIFDILRD